ncbi:YTHDF3 [Cervus elaphus hippelaphus]|uniref:YTHDF3 n=1 Tax=Cervus elaphus hippelaphus TaxID=46360 RepID=A0A212CDR3_CEREH|nr:YTHDF3 [Cervus elaphus hippelaphus]
MRRMPPLDARPAASEPDRRKAQTRRWNIEQGMTGLKIGGDLTAAVTKTVGTALSSSGMTSIATNSVPPVSSAAPKPNSWAAIARKPAKPQPKLKPKGNVGIGGSAVPPPPIKHNMNIGTWDEKGSVTIIQQPQPLIQPPPLVQSQLPQPQPQPPQAQQPQGPQPQAQPHQVQPPQPQLQNRWVAPRNRGAGFNQNNGAGSENFGLGVVPVSASPSSVEVQPVLEKLKAINNYNPKDFDWNLKNGQSTTCRGPGTLTPPPQGGPFPGVPGPAQLVPSCLHCSHTRLLCYLSIHKVPSSLSNWVVLAAWERASWSLDERSPRTRARINIAPGEGKETTADLPVRRIRQMPWCLTPLSGHMAKATSSKRGNRGQWIPWVASWQRVHRLAGAHRSQGWRRLGRGRGAPGDVGALGADFGLCACFTSGGRGHPPGYSDYDEGVWGGSVPRLSVLGHVPLTLTASAPGPSCLLLTQLPRHGHQLLLFSAKSLPGLAPQLQPHHLPVLGLLFLHTMPRGVPFLQEAEHLGARLVFLQDPLGVEAQLGNRLLFQ